ncbi:single-stranded DNA-binding protein, partial [Candidatus Peregrinibacteria bacterium]|nr:single-stranded DNA-binding protein [Candidatus Peregrinibacteria bacterium]
TSTECHELVAWARLAEICQQYLKKGKLIYVEGYLKTRSWDTPEGIKKFKTEIIIQDMIILEKRPKESDVPSTEPEETFEETTLEEAFEANQDEKQEPSAKSVPSIDEDLGL